MIAYYALVIGDPAAPTLQFDGDTIVDVTMETSVSLIGEEMCTDVMEVTVSYDDTGEILRSVPYGTPASLYANNELVGKFYVTSVDRTGKEEYLIRTTSIIGLLDTETFYGGSYNGQPFGTIAESIIGADGLRPYAGFYTRTTTNANYGIGIGFGDTNYGQSNIKVNSEGMWGPAKMYSKLFAKIRLYGVRADYCPSYGLTARMVYIGGVPGQDYASSNAYYTWMRDHSYGLYMEVTRASLSDNYPQWGPVYFMYRGTKISLGTPSGPTVYELSVDPASRTAVINGTTYSLPDASDISTNQAPLHSYGGGTVLDSPDGTYLTNNLSKHNSTVEYYYYRIETQTSEVLGNYVSLKNVNTGYAGVLNISDNSHVYSYVNRAAFIFSSDDFVVYDADTYGDWPCIVTIRHEDVLAQVSYADGIEDLPIYGWLPISSKREALHQLLFSQGVILVKDADGGLLFTAPEAAPAGSIPIENVYDEGSEEQMPHTNTIRLTEHAYGSYKSGLSYSISNADPSSVFVFEEVPNYSVSPGTGLTLYCFNANAAVLSGTGTLSTFYKIHSQTDLVREIADYPDGREVSAPNATLVTLQNSEAVLDRLEAYYGGAKTVNVSILSGSERCGLLYSLFNSFGEAISGFLARASRFVTSVIKASCAFITGYTPPPVGAGYRNYVVLTGSGEWDVPEEVFEAAHPRIRVVLIGGGQGGSSGYAGASGQTGQRSGSTSAAAGGNAGSPGSPGKVLDVTIDNPSASYSYDCGPGGDGGAISNSHSSNNAGEDGDDTEFTDGRDLYSSADGVSSESGYTNFFTGTAYARVYDPFPASFMAGGSGGYHTDTSTTVEYGAATRCDIGGAPGAEGSAYFQSGYIYATGGGGGGGGYGGSGSSGSAASKSGSTYIGGNGGKGGDAVSVPVKASMYGAGGAPGGGGVGGGDGGWVWSGATSTPGTGGAGGYGGRGGDGGDGCIIIYY